MKGPKQTEKLRPNLASEDLQAATLIEVLAYGLSSGEDDVATGILSQVRSDLETLTSMACSAAPDEGIELQTLASTLGGIGKRLDVVAELLRRRSKDDRG